jgi:hypothetical protein
MIKRSDEIKKALNDFRTLDPQLQNLLYESEDELAAFVTASQPPEKLEALPEPTPLTRAERDKLDCELLLTELFGGPEVETVPIGMSPADIAKFRRERPLTLNEQIDQAVRKVLAAAKRGDARPLDVLATVAHRGTKTFQNSLMAAAQEFGDDGPATRYVKAYYSNDRATMREICREIVRSAA